MSFTNAWSDVTPADTELANTLGADIRRLRLDIEERMNASLVTDWAADPIVLKSIFGAQTGLKRVIPACAFQSNQNVQENHLLDGQVNVYGFGVLYYAPLDWIPVGAVITQVEWFTHLGTLTNFTTFLSRRRFIVPVIAKEDVNTTVIISAGDAITPIIIANHVVDSAYQYWISIGSGTFGAGLLYGARITYDLPLLSQR